MGAFWAVPGKCKTLQSSSCEAAVLLANMTVEYDAVITLFLNCPKRKLESFILIPSVVAVTGLFAREIMPFIHPLIWPRYATIWVLYIKWESHSGWKRPLRSSLTIYSHIPLHEERLYLHPSARQASCTHCFYFHGDHPNVFLFSCFSPHSANMRLLQLHQCSQGGSVSPEPPKQHLAFPFISSFYSRFARFQWTEKQLTAVFSFPG